MHKRIPIIIVVLCISAIVVMRLFPIWVDNFQGIANHDSSLIGQYLNDTLNVSSYWQLSFSTLYVLLLAIVTITSLGKIWIPEDNKLALFFSIFFFLSVGYDVQHLSVAYLIPAFILLSFVVLYKNNDKRIDQFSVFNVFLLIGFGSIVSGYFLFLIPYYFVSLFLFYKLNLREFFAGIVGLIVPYWLLFGISYYFEGNFDYFFRFFDLVSIHVRDVSTVPPGFAIYIPVLTFYSLIAIVNDLKNYSSVSIQKRNLFITSNLMVMYSFVLYILSVFPLYVSLLTSAIPFGLLFSSYLQTNTRTRSSFFFIILISSILFSFVTEF